MIQALCADVSAWGIIILRVERESSVEVAWSGVLSTPLLGLGSTFLGACLSSRPGSLGGKLVLYPLSDSSSMFFIPSLVAVCVCSVQLTAPVCEVELQHRIISVGTWKLFQGGKLKV